MRGLSDLSDINIMVTFHRAQEERIPQQLCAFNLKIS